MLARLQQPRQLHRDGGTARDDVTAAHELPGGASHRQRIDAMMPVEALVLIRKQQTQKARVDVLSRNRQPPAALFRRVGAQQAPLAVEHDMGIFEIPGERRRPQRIDPGRAGGRNDGSRCAGRRDYALPARHLAEISIAPVAVRPKRSGRYMSSTFACGSTYRPGDTARTT